MNKKELLEELYAMESSPAKIGCPADIAARLLPYRDKKTEHFIVFGVDNKNHIVVEKVSTALWIRPRSTPGKSSVLPCLSRPQE